MIKQLNFRSCTLGVIVIGATLGWSGTGLAKDYTRSCSATISIGATTPSGQRLRGATYNFSGRGTVGWFAPNKARERARRNIDECIDAAWARRHQTSRPSACTESNQVHSYPFTGLQFGLQQAVCRANPGHDRILVSLTVQFSGDRGCLNYTNTWNRVVTQAYTVQCPTREFERGVDRPGSDYRNFVPAGPRASLCRDACIADQPRCRAWTYVAPSRTNPRPRCWLKSAVPSPTASSGCTSGVISDL